MQRLNEDLKNGSFACMYLLYGEEDYLRLHYKKRFRERICGEDTLNYNEFSDKVEVTELISQLQTLPFFAARRLVVVDGSAFSRSRVPEQLLDFLPQLPESTCLLWLDESVDKRSALYKRFKEGGYVCELKRQDAQTLSRWGAQYLARAGKKIRGSTMELLVELCGTQMSYLASELEKLIAYTGEREVVEDGDVRAICSAQAESRVFEMITQLSLGHREAALRLYQDLLELREPPMRILFLLGRNYRQLLQARELLQEGRGRSELATALSLSPWAAGKLMEQARGYSPEALRARFRRCLEMDEAIKTGQLSDRMAVELLLTES